MLPKRNSKLLVIFSFQAIVHRFINGDYTSVREDKAAVFPPLTVLQVAFGLAVPAQVPNRTIFTNLGALHNIPLPSKVSQLYPYARKHRQYTHDSFYKLMEKIFAWNGYSSRECIQKSICQISRIESKNGDLLREILQLLFSFSVIKNPVADIHYFIAEQNGKNLRIDCSELYPSCPTSFLDLITESG